MGATSTSTEGSEPVGDVISAQPSFVEHLDDDLRRLPGARPVRQVFLRRLPRLQKNQNWQQKMIRFFAQLQ
jgi:hypothetical protein